MRTLTTEEKQVLFELATAWNSFLHLPTVHPDDTDEFRHFIHGAQNIVLARVGVEEVLIDGNLHALRDGR